jgi:hypothetical protein
MENWTEYAKCAKDPQIRYEQTVLKYDRFHDGNAEQLNENKQYCSNCPVRLNCYGEAMMHTNINVQYPYHDDVGIWGGTTQRERRNQKRKTLRQIQLLQEQMKEQFRAS